MPWDREPCFRSGGRPAPRNPGFKAREQVDFERGLSINLSMSAIARVETGSLTPALFNVRGQFGDLVLKGQCVRPEGL
jgi:hypothetical protein